MCYSLDQCTLRLADYYTSVAIRFNLVNNCISPPATPALQVIPIHKKFDTDVNDTSCAESHFLNFEF